MTTLLTFFTEIVSCVFVCLLIKHGLIACIYFVIALGQMWPRLVFLQQVWERGAGKFCQKKLVVEERGRET